MDSSDSVPRFWTGPDCLNCPDTSVLNFGILNFLIPKCLVNLLKALLSIKKYLDPIGLIGCRSCVKCGSTGVTTGKLREYTAVDFHILQHCPWIQW
jgi:hypothetical protein